MRYYTDLYNQARQAGAKPILYCYIKTDFAWRCFGKEFPDEAHLRTDIDVYDWQARVLTFGDFRVSLSSEGENVFLCLQTQEMSTYTITLDNADRYFTDLLENETLLTGEIALYQGFSFPGFTEADFIPLFTGRVSSVDLSTLTLKLTADTSIVIETPETPTIDTTTTYSLLLVSGAEVEGEFLYTELADIFYTSELFHFVIEIERVNEDVAEVLFEIENQAEGNNRIEIGITADNFLYVSLCDDVSSATPTYTTVTADFPLGAGAHRVEIDINEAENLVEFRDNGGNTYSEKLSEDTEWIYQKDFVSKFYHGMVFDIYGNLFACYYAGGESGRVDKYDSDGNYLASFTGEGAVVYPEGIAIETNGYIWVCCAHPTEANRRVLRINPDTDTVVLSLQLTGVNAYPSGVAITSTNVAYITDYSNDRVDVYNFSGDLLTSFGDTYLDGPLGIVLDSLDNIWVSNYTSKDVTHFGSNRAYLDTLSSGTIDGVAWRLCKEPGAAGRIIVGHYDGVTIFTALGVYETHIDVGSASIGGVATKDNDLYIANGGGGVELWEEVRVFPRWRADTSPSTSDIIRVAPEFDGEIVAVQANDALWKNDGDSESPIFAEKSSGADLGLDLISGADWEEWGTIDEYLEVITPEERLSYDTEFIPGTTENYSLGQQNTYLPLPYGDMTENSDSGAWVAPQIGDRVYCIAGWPVLSEANGNVFSIYVDGELQTAFYSINTCNDYEGQGNITTVTFWGDQGNAIITVNCKGRESVGDGTGTLLTNPIDIIEDLLAYVSATLGTSAFLKDETSFALAKEEALLREYTCAGVIQTANTLAYWIKSILSCFLMTHEYDGEGRLAIRYFTLQNTEDIKETIEEYEAITLSAGQNVSNICNRLLINYANSYAKIDRRYKTGGEISYFRTYDEQSQQSAAKYGEYSQELSFNWTRNTNSVATVVTILLARYADPLWNVYYLGQDIKFLPLDLLDQIEGVFQFFHGKSAIGELREKVVNLDDFTSTLTLQLVNFSTIDYTKIGNVFVGSIHHPVFVADTDGRVYVGSR